MRDLDTEIRTANGTSYECVVPGRERGKAVLPLSPPYYCRVHGVVWRSRALQKSKREFAESMACRRTVVDNVRHAWEMIMEGCLERTPDLAASPRLS